MSDFYIASFSLDSDTLCHYGRPGMKWYQHIFGKEPNGRYTAKKRAKMVKKYGEKKTRLKEAQSVEKEYGKAIMRDKKDKYDDAYREEYLNALSDIIIEGSNNKETIRNLLKNLDKQKRISHAIYENAEKDSYDELKEKKMNDELHKLYNEEVKLVETWTEDVFGRKPDPNDTSKNDWMESGANFIESLYLYDTHDEITKDKLRYFIKEVK